MKSLIFFIFTYITYVFSGTVGPLGFAALIPPYPQSPDYETNPNSITGVYGVDDLLLFLSRGHTHNCLIHLQDACTELKEVYGGFTLLGELQHLCEHQNEECQRYADIKADLCGTNLLDYAPDQLETQVNSQECNSAYTLCRLRSPGCSYEYKEKCRKDLNYCHKTYLEYLHLQFFLDYIGVNFTTKDFFDQLKATCTSLAWLNDKFVQLCINPASLTSELISFYLRSRNGEQTFFDYPSLSSAAALSTQGFASDLFSPKTDPDIDPAYLVGFLVNESDYTRFMEVCTYAGLDCMGLGFFPKTQHFCDVNERYLWSTHCENAYHTIFDKYLPNTKHSLESQIWNQQHAESILFTGIDVELCLKYRRPCSYLGNLDPRFTRLCQVLEGYCSFGLEIGSALSMFESKFHDIDFITKSDEAQTKCLKKLSEICPVILNTSVDFLTFCLRPRHTCYALQELNRLRCDDFKKELTNVDHTETECVSTLIKHEPYLGRCPHPDEYFDFFTACHEKYPENKYLKELMTSTLKEWLGETGESEKPDDDGF